VTSFRCLLIWFFLVATSWAAVPSESFVVNGLRLLRGSSVIADDVTKLEYRKLVDLLGKKAQPDILANVAMARNPDLISTGFTEIFIKNMVKYTDTVPGLEDTARLLLSDSSPVVTGAIGEIKRLAFFGTDKLVPNGMRRIVTTPSGTTDIDVSFRWKDVADVFIEVKEYKNSLTLTDDVRIKIDKLGDLVNGGAKVFISAGEAEPSKKLIEYAVARQVGVLYGGLMHQRNQLMSALGDSP